MPLVRNGQPVVLRRQSDLPRSEWTSEVRAATCPLCQRRHPRHSLTHCISDSIELPPVYPVARRHPAAADRGDILQRQVALECRGGDASARIELHATERSLQQLEELNSA